LTLAATAGFFAPAAGFFATAFALRSARAAFSASSRFLRSA
jgi:hypothetical protein